MKASFGYVRRLLANELRLTIRMGHGWSISGQRSFWVMLYPSCTLMSDFFAEICKPVLQTNEERESMVDAAARLC
ncbi:hypothetical protein T10_10673 [Trichinella papuae]|uniref:Uncharacterized protein n=1 Tax=Trichinella papuae TaxID=268474 RepID=A0A0V1MUP5_9BILA|nr:hypothetical protein T10_7679 [Trichinella papuae]KRZ66786.1 hypothetical protein T10_13223 [Trichinella papuae]KRZ75221.1 hypothetical protein T10_10673 [Trichinella papuae]